VVGHDFGAMVSWRLAMLYPDRLLHMVIANVPHPAVMANFLRTHPDQIRRSWYAFFFQLPWVPEALIRASTYRMLSAAMAKGLSAEQLLRYRRTWMQPHAMTSMLNWYRALVWRLGFIKYPGEKIDVPTLVVWGKQDPHLSYKMAQPSVDMCTRGNLVMFEDATHWVHQDKPQEMNQLLVRFLAQSDERGFSNLAPFVPHRHQ
jgi:pimeloyl-ACP methyl ester carboxylesterase